MKFSISPNRRIALLTLIAALVVMIFLTNGLPYEQVVKADRIL